MRGCLWLAVALVAACGCCGGMLTFAIGADDLVGGCCTQIEAADGFQLPLTAIISAVLAVVTAVGLLLYWLFQKGQRDWSDLIGVPVVILLGFFLFYVPVQYANVKLDPSAAQHHKVDVLDRYRREPAPDCRTQCKTEYILVVPSWRAGYGSRMRLSVSEAVYNQVKVGGQVEVTTHSGLFGAEWLERKP